MARSSPFSWNTQLQSIPSNLRKCAKLFLRVYSIPFLNISFNFFIRFAPFLLFFYVLASIASSQTKIPNGNNDNNNNIDDNHQKKYCESLIGLYCCSLSFHPRHGIQWEHATTHIHTMIMTTTNETETDDLCGDINRDNITDSIALDILEQLPKRFEIRRVKETLQMKLCPTGVVLLQELQRYNGLVERIEKTLKLLRKVRIRICVCVCIRNKFLLNEHHFDPPNSPRSSIQHTPVLQNDAFTYTHSHSLSLVSFRSQCKNKQSIRKMLKKIKMYTYIIQYTN